MISRVVIFSCLPAGRDPIIRLVSRLRHDRAHDNKARTTISAIDIHHHYFPPELIDEIKQHGKALGGIEGYSTQASKRTIPIRFNFPKAGGFAPDPRMAEVPNRLDAMTKGNVGIAMSTCTASVGC